MLINVGRWMFRISNLPHRAEGIESLFLTDGCRTHVARVDRGLVIKSKKPVLNAGDQGLEIPAGKVGASD